MTQPGANPKVYHIVHVDRLVSILADGNLLCDAVIASRLGTGTVIGMSRIKQRRLQLPIASRPGLMVGECVPFYFCPRSVMLYLLHRRNDPDLNYQGGEDPIIHLEFDLHRVVQWAEACRQRWAFTLSNAGAYYFEDRCDLRNLDEVNWEAVGARQWSGPLKEGKQAEFLVEREVPWDLVERIGVRTHATGQQAVNAISPANHRPDVEIKLDWYY
jgi:hypothetical protein